MARLIPTGNPERLDPAFTIPFLSRLGAEVSQQVAEASPVGETGELSHSWSYSVPNDHLAVIKSDSGHSGFPEWGTRSPIRPRDDNKAGGYLVFWSHGRKYVVKEVRGQSPQLYVFNTLRRIFPTAKINAPQISHFK